MKNLLFVCVLLAITTVSCEVKPERVVESEWNAEQPKLVAFYVEEDGNKYKQSEEKYYETGTTEYTGSYDVDGNRHGDWKYYYTNGNLWSTGSYVNGLKTGKKEVFWPEGQLRYEGFFENDEKSGHWTFYDTEGGIIEEMDY